MWPKSRMLSSRENFYLHPPRDRGLLPICDLFKLLPEFPALVWVSKGKRLHCSADPGTFARIQQLMSAFNPEKPCFPYLLTSHTPFLKIFFEWESQCLEVFLLSESPARHLAVLFCAAHGWCAVGKHFWVPDGHPFGSRSCFFCSFLKLERMRITVAKEERQEAVE